MATRFFICFVCAGLLALPGVARANPSMMRDFDFAHPAFAHANPAATVRMVIQVSQDDPGRWGLALHNAQNAMALLGQGHVQIVVVAYGPGLHLLLAGSPTADDIATLDHEGVEFDACNNTLQFMGRELGHLPMLLPQAVIVPAGIVRIMQLEQHGFVYVKP